MRIDNSSIRVNRNTCIACGICVDRCIMDNLRLSLAPCRQACPLDMNCQGYIRLLAMGKEDEAFELVRHYGPLLQVLASECTAPCETVCSRKKEDGAVTILELKRYLAGKYAEQLAAIATPDAGSGKSVAVIGSDAAGLACAMRARQAGHAATVFRIDDNEALVEVVSSLSAAGVDFVAVDRFVGNNFDAVVVTSPAYGEKAGLVIETVEVPSHLVAGSLFCVDSGKAGRSTIHALAEAFETMDSVERMFAGDPLEWGRGLFSQEGAVKQFRVDTRVGNDAKRILPETGAIYDPGTAREQAGRCYGCGRAFEKNQTCWYCLPCELECPQQALEVRIPYLVR